MTSLKRLERRKDKSARNKRRFGAMSAKAGADKFSMAKEMQRIILDTGHKDIKKNRIHLPGLGWIRPSTRGGIPYQIQQEDQSWTDASFDQCKDIRLKLNAALLEASGNEFRPKKTN